MSEHASAADQRTCTRCGVLKPLAAFRFVSPQHAPSRRGTCRACENARRRDQAAQRQQEAAITEGYRRLVRAIFAIPERQGRRW